MVPLSLFNEKCPVEERRLLADKMLDVRPHINILFPKERFGSGFGKPQFPTAISMLTSLADSVTTDSWYIVKLLNLKLDFITEMVENWPDCKDYQKSMCSIKAINVVNDGAKRSIKLSNDFISLAKSELQYQSMLQVVNQNRKCQPYLRKRLQNN